MIIINIKKLKGISIFLCFALIFSCIIWTPTVKAEECVNIGDYVIFGSYLDEPIMWIVVGKDSNGVCLFSKDILTIKPYDAAESGNYRKGNNDVEKYGSSEWSDSNLREWLNSADKKVKYTTIPPNDRALKFKNSGYDKEKGFLYDFTRDEISLINVIKHDSVFDKIYIPSLDKLKSVNRAGFSLSAKPTKMAVKTFKARNISSNNNYYYWNRTSSKGNNYYFYNYYHAYNKVMKEETYDIKNSSYCLNKIDNEGKYYWTHEYKDYEDSGVKFNDFIEKKYYSVWACDFLGVRPMLYLKDSLVINNGEGTEDNPYTLDIRKSNNSLADVSKNHWAYEPIKYLLENNIIKPNEDGTIKPDENISTIKYLELLSMATNYNYYEKKIKFSEIKDDHWMNELVKIGGYCIEKCKENGERYNGKLNISREDAADILIHALDLQDEGYSDSTLNKFTDEDKITNKESVAIAVENNLMIGLNGRFEPNKSLTRAEVYMILYRMITED